MRLTKPSAAFVLLIQAACPTICASLCAAHLCCPNSADLKPTAQMCCAQCAKPKIPKLGAARKSSTCCERMAKRVDPPATSTKAETLKTGFIILPSPIEIPEPPVVAGEAKIVPSDDRAPPGPRSNLHHARAPPIV